MMAKSSLEKVRVVLNVAKINQDFMQDLKANPVIALNKRGFDLSAGEVSAIIDVLNDTQNSPLAGRLSEMRMGL